MRIHGLVLAGTALVSLGMSVPALAGGFQRSVADTDVLFETGSFATRLGATYVQPNRGFETIAGVGGSFGDYTGTYGLPSAAVYYGSDMFGCAGTYVESFAAEADYDQSPGGALPRQASSQLNGQPIGVSNVARLNVNAATTASTSRTINTEFDSEELGATCRASYSTETMRFSLLGGLFIEDFEFNGASYGERNLNPLFSQSAQGQQLLAGALAGSPVGSRLVLPTQVQANSEGDYKVGFRIGAAFEMPEIALRVQALYRSEIKHDDIAGNGSVSVINTAYVVTPDGTQRSIPLPQIAALVNGTLAQQGLTPGTVIPVASYLNEATSPQYLQINGQTGIAPGTLLLGSFRWTDWSTNGSVISTISSTQTGTSSSYAPYNWRDGYTASLGIGRAFNDKISGAVSLGYDRGVSTGSETTYTDLYTVSAGVSFKPAAWSEFRFGGLVGFWNDGSQSIANGAYFNGTVGDDMVYGANASIKLTF
ncbi:hypothetical protein ASG43_08805 [Aureimonas sp. Leaf454]|uniref:hypothetical protein n=1 Tax=Aureimonas sp. Leaf454 TaxID=1736381 RepID=UPI0006F3B4AA|nr:hypothetical protein [Aureimonas sp. Leaf454]KQT48926.1 hypothetical protein ASG43_08805 [Aureimonas sp. Leaf454]